MATTDAEWQEHKPRITDETRDNGEEPNAKKSKYKLSEKKRRTFRRTSVLLFRVCCLSFLVVLYVIFGALVLHFVERPAEETRVVEAQRINATVRAWLLEVLENHTLLESNATSRSAFVEQIVANVSVATVLGAFEVRSSSNWDFGQSLFFAVTVVTTIGEWVCQYISRHVMHVTIDRGMASCDVTCRHVNWLWSLTTGLWTACACQHHQSDMVSKLISIHSSVQHYKFTRATLR